MLPSPVPFLIASVLLGLVWLALRLVDEWHTGKSEAEFVAALNAAKAAPEPDPVQW